MVRVTKEDYTRYKALEEAAAEFAEADYRDARSQLAKWKATFHMLSDKGLYTEIRETIATMDSGKPSYILKSYELPDNDPDPEEKPEVCTCPDWQLGDPHHGDCKAAPTPDPGEPDPNGGKVDESKEAEQPETC